MSDKNHIQKYLNRGARLGYVADTSHEWFYGYDSGSVIERIWDFPGNKWKTSGTILPTGAGISKILANFIVLRWPRNMDSNSSEIHLFSMDESGVLWDYLVGLGAASSISLLEA